MIKTYKEIAIKNEGSIPVKPGILRPPDFAAIGITDGLRKLKGARPMIGAILRQLRQEQKYSLRMLSQKTGLSLGFICDIENGRCNLSIASLRKLASALGVSADIFLKDPVGDNDQNGLEITRHDPEQSK